MAAIRAQEVAKTKPQVERPLLDEAQRSPPISDVKRRQILSLLEGRIRRPTIARQMRVHLSTVHNVARRYYMVGGKIMMRPERD